MQAYIQKDSKIERDYEYCLQKSVWTVQEGIFLIEELHNKSYHIMTRPIYDRLLKTYLISLNEIAASGVEEHMFVDFNFCAQSVQLETLIYPRSFIKWAYRQNKSIPHQLCSLLPKAILEEIQKKLAYVTISINIKSFAEAFEKESNASSTTNRRDIMAYLLSSLSFTADQIYQALTTKGDAEADPARQARRWKEHGKQLVEGVILDDDD